MCEIIEKLQKESAAEATLKKAMEIALKLLKKGKDTVTEIAETTDLPLDTIKQLAIDNGIAYTI